MMFDPLHVFVLGVVIFVLAKWGAGLPIRKLMKTTMLVGIASISILVFQSLFYKGGTKIFQIGFIAPSYEGFMMGLAIGLRILGIVASSMVIAKTTDPRDIFLAVVRMGLPYKIAYGLFTALRFIPLLQHDAQTIMDAQFVRGIAVKGGGVSNWIKRFGHFLVPLIANSMRRGDQSALAADVRAFGLYPTRTYSRDLVIPSFEKWFVLFWVVALVIYVLVFQQNILGAVFFTHPDVLPQ